MHCASARAIVRTSRTRTRSEVVPVLIPRSFPAFILRFAHLAAARPAFATESAASHSPRNRSSLGENTS